MEKRVITSEEFYKEFIDALKSEKKVFKLENCIINGNVDILEVYKRIENDEELRKLIDKDSNLNLYIEIDFIDVEFKGHVKFT